MQKQTQIYKTIHTVASFVTFYISTRTEIISVKNYNLLTITGYVIEQTLTQEKKFYLYM